MSRLTTLGKKNLKIIPNPTAIPPVVLPPHLKHLEDNLLIGP